MRYWTYGEIKDKVRKDLGIEQEEFVTATEMMGYCNMAIDDAESEIHTIYEDYFLTKTDVDTVANQSDYAMPSNIYANKIRGVIYNDGSSIYKVKRYTNFQDMFEAIENDKLSTAGDMRFFIQNDSASAGVQMMLVPAPTVSITGAIKLYYIRNANRMEADTSICDIPEFVDYVIQFMKVRCYEKEGHPNTALAVQMLDYKKKNMISTLSNMVPDGDSELQQDFSFYWEMGDGIDFNIY